ncbi:hypothetical protein KKA50_00255 [Patescibacteria group bacterium]|nr:hypothetical protein [Patescibacteria group bacterium]
MDKKLQKALTFTLAIVFVGVGGFFLVREANAATPADALFPLDKFTESVTRLAILNPEAEIAFETEVLDERLSELDALVAENVDTTDALEEIDAQVDVLDTTVADGDSKLTLEQREELRLQYQEKIQAHIQTMTQEQLKTESGDATQKANMQKAIDTLDTKLTSSKKVELEVSSDSNGGENSNGSGSTNGKGN